MSQPILLGAEDRELLVFGQQHVETQDFFAEHVGNSHTVGIADFPHTRLIQGDESSYLDYLEVSWRYYKPEANTLADRLRRVEEMSVLFADIQRSWRINKPVRLYQRPDNRYVILDGNHRSAIAYVLGIDLPAIVVPAHQALREIVELPSRFFGAGNRDMPYQSLYLDSKTLVEGRRADLLGRIRKVEPEDLVGATVLDMGSNIGSNCYLAVEHGAKSTLGLELSPELATSAIRLNSFYARECRFQAHDLTKPFLPEQKFDLVFCLSVLGHLPNTEGVVETIRACTGKVLYLECHSGQSREDHDYLLNSDNFSSVDLVGYNQDDRMFYRCET
jgi:hypothetical protein